MMGIVMRGRVVVVAFAFVAAFALAGTAGAVPPTLRTVGQQDRHPVAIFDAPHADDATIFLATQPDRATDGRFLDENIKALDFLTDSEIQTGRWVGESQLDPGNYWVMLLASPDFNSCYIIDTGEYDPACANGFSNVVTLTIQEPAIRYRASVTVYRYLGQASLRLIATPLGEKRPYRVCYRLSSGRRRCLIRSLAGYDWNSSAEGRLTISTRSLPRFATFSWYVGGFPTGLGPVKLVATKRVRIR